MTQHTEYWQIREHGFTLVELMIVVAIISILMSMAIPSLLQSRKAANEAAAIGYMRALHSAQTMYHLRFGVYADSDERLVAAGYIKGTSTKVGQNRLSGYNYIVDPISHSSWYALAFPVEAGQTGDRHFYIDTSGVLRWSESPQVNETSRTVD